MHQCVDPPTYSNLKCHDCLQTLNVCLHPLCTSSRLFCPVCLNLSSHNSHIEFVFSSENVVNMPSSAVLNVPHPLIVTQKQALEKILCDIDAFENVIKKTIKSLRSNLGEKYSLISQSLESNGCVYVDKIQDVLRRYTVEYASGFDVKLSDLLTKPSVSSSYIFDLQSDKLQQLQDMAINNIKAIQDTIKLKHEKSINPLLAVPWGNSINAFSLHKDTIALAGQYLRVLHGKHHEGKLNMNFYDDPIRSISYSRDGSLLAMAGGSKCTLFNTVTMKPLALKLLTQHSASFHAVDISPDNRLIAFGVKPKKSAYKVCIAEIETEEIKQILFDNNSVILSMKFSRDNRFLALAGCDYAVFVYHREAPDQLFVKTQVLRDNDDIISEIAFSEDSSILISGSVDGRCYIYARKKNTNEEAKAILNGNETNDTSAKTMDSTSNHAEGSLSVEEQKQEDNDCQNSDEQNYPQSTLESNESRSRLANLQVQFQKLNKQEIEETKPGNLNESIQKVLVDVAMRTQQQSDEDHLREEAQKIVLGREQIHANPFVAQSMLSDGNYMRGRVEERKRETQNEEQQQLQEVEDQSKISYCSRDLSSKYDLVSYFKLSKAKSIRSIHIHSSGTFLAIATSDQILLYDLLEISTPRLLYTIPTTGTAVVNQVRFSSIDDTLFFSDNTGQFYSTKFR